MISATTPIRKTSAKFASLALSLLGILPLGAGAQGSETPPCRFVNIANLKLDDTGLASTVEGSINHDKTVMLIASGAQNTMLTKIEATKLGVAPPQANKNAKTARDERSQLDEFAIGTIELHNTRILTLQKASIFPEYGAVVGADLLFQHDLELSLAAGQIKFFNPLGCEQSTLSYWDKNAAAVPLENLSATDYRPIVPVEIEGKKMRALIDTATPISVINLAAAARIGITPQSSGVTAMKSASHEKNARSASWVAPFRLFAIGGEEIKNIKIPMLNLTGVVNAENSAATPDMILGEDFLRAHHVLFAVSQHTFYFSYLGGKVFNMDTGAQAAPAKS